MKKKISRMDASLFPETHMLGALRGDSQGLVVDLFAGAGGASTGMEQGLGKKISVAINHAPAAIACHRRNHPDARHYLSDVFEVDPLEATQGKAVDVLWGSPDCTSYSQAAGGTPVRRFLRSLPWVMLKWAGKTRPRYICAENVLEMQKRWGKLIAKRDQNGQPILLPGHEKLPAHERFQLTSSKHPKHGSRHWHVFLRSLRRLGYHVEYRTLNAADYGAPTTRTRLFIVASRDTTFIPWPEPTHARVGDPRVISGELLPWVAVSTCLDFDLPTTSVFDRARPLATATITRMAQGIYRNVLQDSRPFIATYNHAGKGCRSQSLDRPIGTLVAANEARGLVSVALGNDDGDTLDFPSPVRPAEKALSAPSILKFQQNSTSIRADGPLDTVMAGATRFAVLDAALQVLQGGAVFGATLLGVGGRAAQTLPKSVSEPSDTTTTKADVALSVAALLPETQLASMTQGTQMHTAHQVYEMMMTHCPEAEPYADHDARVIRKTLGDTSYVLSAIGLRMLLPDELKRASGFPADYVIDAGHDGKALSKADQVRLIGNSVPPPFSRAITSGLRLELLKPAADCPPAWLRARRQVEQAAD